MKDRIKGHGGKPARRSTIVRLGLALLLPACLALPAPAQVYIGLDQDGDLQCDYTDMWVPPLEAGERVDIDVYWDNTGQGAGGLFAFGCTVCIGHRGYIVNDTFAYSDEIPATWTMEPVQNSLDDPATVEVDQWIIDSYPCYKCWLLRATDFTFSSPIPDGEHRFGTLTFEAAEDRGWSSDMIIDGHPYHSGWLDGNFVSGGCSAGYPQDETCQCIPPLTGDPNPPELPPCATENLSWGSLKTLFRGNGTAARESDAAKDVPGEENRAPLSKTPGSCGDAN
jgi:hypothetical protein